LLQSPESRHGIPDAANVPLSVAFVVFAVIEPGSAGNLAHTQEFPVHDSLEVSTRLFNQSTQKS